MAKAKVRIFTTLLCPYCYMAKSLLKRKGVAFEEIDVTFDPARRAEMQREANGANTVPQIWIGDLHVGGSDELHQLEREGRLDELLAG